MIDFYWLECVGDNLVFHCHDGLKIKPRPFLPYCWKLCRADDPDRACVDALRHRPLKKYEYLSESMMHAQVGVNTFESDIPLEFLYMRDLGLTIGTVPIAYVDIETKHADKIDMVQNPIISIGMVIVKDGQATEHYYTDKHGERAMLEQFVADLKHCGVMVTYNGGDSVWADRSFDVPYLARRYAIAVKGRVDRKAMFVFDEIMRSTVFVDVYLEYRAEVTKVNRVVDGGFSLDNVSKLELGEGKIEHTENISDMSDADLERYNMQDVYLLRKLDEKFRFVQRKIAMAKLSHSLLVKWNNNHRYASMTPIGLTDNLLLTKARQLGMALPNKGRRVTAEAYTGAIVLEPMVGVHKGVQNYDVKQMYPSIMIHEKISPDKDKVLIPSILKELMELRAKYKEIYKQTKSPEDNMRQYATKVAANIIYGGYANPYCRIYDAKLAAKITECGRAITLKMKDYAEACGYAVVYGDTDSCYVQIHDQSKAQDVLDGINATIAPYVVEAGGFYDAMIFTASGGKALKKRYAGIADGKVTIVGMQALSNAVCQMTRDLQRNILRMVLEGASESEIRQHMEKSKMAVLDGTLDKQLVISKKVKPIAEYNLGEKSKGQPYMRALQQYVAKTGREVPYIEYVYTTDDCAPIIEGQQFPDNIDRELYWKRYGHKIIAPILASAGIDIGEFHCSQSLDAFLSS